MRQWTPEERQRQSELIRQWQPWKQSTGPRTVAGKAVCAQNVVVGQQRRERELEQARAELAAAQQRIRKLTRKKASVTDWELLAKALDF